ncbi:MAG: hypothetical protein CL862_14510 [Cyanobium sp. NAT70]|nr:hypothetical protein [Cyanobium sp. NAT70]MAR13027.1 hypothetical protein [Blastopirellula sp.]|tara:strand:- start:86 stop:394 length:309 start_codon:yes stop_codon:yes gene_type:complete
MQALASFDPAPLFALSLIPYLFFLYWAGQCRSLPKLTLWGFRLTLLFVLVTILAAVLALRCCQAELVAIDALHGGAEAFLTLSNAVLVWGLLRRPKKTVNNS